MGRYEEGDGKWELWGSPVACGRCLWNRGGRQGRGDPGGKYSSLSVVLLGLPMLGLS